MQTALAEFGSSSYNSSHSKKPSVRFGAESAANRIVLRLLKHSKSKIRNRAISTAVAISVFLRESSLVMYGYRYESCLISLCCICFWKLLRLLDQRIAVG